jgi:hypothetical protein
MKPSSRFVSIASLIVGIAIATVTGAIGQGMQGGMGPGMMQGDRASRTPAPNMPHGGMSQGMMGQGMMCPMMNAMMQGGMGQGMMGPGMIGQGMTGSGMSSGMFGSRVTPIMNLSVDDVRGYLGTQIERLNNNRLKIGNINADGETINAEIVTVDNSLVQKMKVDRHTGVIEYVN